jgi:myo-inositol-1(or 4)-monophosphatase
MSLHDTIFGFYRYASTMQPLLNIAIQAARQASDVIIRYAHQIERLTISEKSRHDYFTEVDVKAEQTIIQAIHKAHPNHGILGEECGSYLEDAECVWIIDPLDGTSNYLHGFPFYAISIAVQIKNQIEHAVVYDPIRHECFSASRGRGARLNDHRIRVSKQNHLSASMLGVNLQHQYHSAIEKSKIESLIHECASARRTGSVALELAYVAAGRLDGFFGFGLKPWDIAGGALLVQEAGGMVSDERDGESYLRQGNIFAGTPKVHKALIQFLND